MGAPCVRYAGATRAYPLTVMKHKLVTLLISCGLLACHRNDVDVQALNTNPFDADHPGDNGLFTVDSVWTYDPAGPYYAQCLKVTVHEDRFPAPTPHAVYVIETGSGDTLSVAGPLVGLGEGVYRNLGVTLDNTYCYRIELRVNGEGMRVEQRCAVAEL